MATANSEKKLENLTPFEKGKSGNPTGRPKIPEHIISAFRGPMTDLSVKTLTSILDGSDEGAKTGDRLRAAEIVLDRAWGKPVQQTEVTGEDGGAIELVKRIIVNGSGNTNP